MSKVRTLIQFITNPKLLLCLLIGWLITNGWSYIAFGVGTYYGIDWLTVVAGAYLAFLWLPISPEKLVTCAIAIALLNKFFPNDQKTLAVLKSLLNKVQNTLKKK